VSTTSAYQAELKARGFTADAAQLQGLAALQRCEDEWIAYKARRGNAVTKFLIKPPLPKGVYLYGGVGRGKSFLMESFFQAVPLSRKARLHFHEFMREVHRELHELKGIADPLDELTRRMARRYRLICFDEFHIADVTDAMILLRLLEGMVKHRISIVTTSNFKPDELYPNGLHRDRVLPAIALLNETLQVVNVDAGIDYLPTPSSTTARSAPLPTRHCRCSSSNWPRCRMKTPACASNSANCAPSARLAARSGSSSAPCVAVRARRTTTWSWPPSSTRCFCRMCPRCRCAWPARRAASPGSLMCSMTAASNWSSRPPLSPRGSTPRDRSRTSFRAL
jgi:predicted ATPase